MKVSLQFRGQFVFKKMYRGDIPPTILASLLSRPDLSGNAQECLKHQNDSESIEKGQLRWDDSQFELPCLKSCYANTFIRADGPDSLKLVTN